MIATFFYFLRALFYRYRVFLLSFVFVSPFLPHGRSSFFLRTVPQYSELIARRVQVTWVEAKGLPSFVKLYASNLPNIT